MSEFDSGLLKRINSDLDKLSLLTQEEKNVLNKTANFAISVKKDSLQPYLLPKEELFNTTELIAIDLSEIIKNNGYPAYTTSAGWLGYSLKKLEKL